MKTHKWKSMFLYIVAATVWGLLVASLFGGCNLYEKEEVRVIRCPHIETDTITVSEWENGTDEPTEEVGH